MFSAAHGQSKTNINLSRQAIIQLHRAPFYLSLLITCCQLHLKCELFHMQVCLGLKIDFCKLKLRFQISLTYQTVVLVIGIYL